MKEKIVIVTVYNSENCGSFLQAYGMYTTLNKLGYDAAFLKRPIKNTSHEFLPHIISSLKFLLKFNIKKAISITKRWFVYNRLIKSFRVCEFDSDFYNKSKVIIIGSDTLWNFNEDYFRVNSDTYLGRKFVNKIVVPFAVSVANTSENLFKSVFYNIKPPKYEYCYVRDNQTKKSLEQVGIQNSSLVSDPSLFLNKADYQLLCLSIDKSKKYLVIYFFGILPDNLHASITSFAKRNKLTIVSFFTHYSWCDIYVDSNPSLMVSYYSIASYVLTNTFHGTLFAINFGINFAVHDEGKMKVNDLLLEYDCCNHLFSKSSDVEKILVLPTANGDLVKNNRFESINKLCLALLKSNRLW